MTLVVAQFRDRQVELVSDTLITFGWDESTGRYDEAKTQEFFSRALPKLVLLRDDVAVGMAGADLDWAAEQLVLARHAPIGELLEMMAEFDEVDFIAAQIGQRPQLWKVSRHARIPIEDRSVPQRAWIGDEEPYSRFQQLEAAWDKLPGRDVAFRLMSSMQGLLNIYRPKSVGGYLVRVTATAAGFRFVADPQRVFGVSPAGLVMALFENPQFCLV